MYIYLYFWLFWVFIAALGPSLVAAARGYCLFQCLDFSLRWFLLLWNKGSRHVGFSSCSAQGLAALQQSGPGIKAVSCVLADEFLTTGPPGKFPKYVLYSWLLDDGLRMVLFQEEIILGHFMVWQPTPVFLPGESHGRRSLVGYSPRVAESDATERLHSLSLSE